MTTENTNDAIARAIKEFASLHGIDDEHMNKFIQVKNEHRSIFNIYDDIIRDVVLDMLYDPDDFYFVLTCKKYYYANIDHIRRKYVVWHFTKCTIPLDDMTYCWKQMYLWLFMYALDNMINRINYNIVDLVKRMKALRYVKQEFTYFEGLRLAPSCKFIINQKNLEEVRNDIDKEISRANCDGLLELIKSTETYLGKLEDWFNFDDRLLNFECPQKNSGGRCRGNPCNIIELFSVYNIKPICID
jgi:hypothetical protein